MKLPTTRTVVSTAALCLAAATVCAQQTDPVFANDTGDGIAAFMGHLQAVALPRWWLTFAAMLLATGVLAMLGVDSRSQPATADDGKGRQLPPHLRLVSVLGARYGLDTFTGTVQSIQSSTESTTTATFAGGQWQQPGVLYSPLGNQTMVTTTTRSAEVVLLCPDGSTSLWRFRSGKLPVAKEQKLSLVARRTLSGTHDCLVAYNHTTQALVTFNFSGAHSVSSRLSWLAATVVGTVGFVWGYQAAAASFMSTVTPAVPAAAPGVFLWVFAAACAAVVALVPLVVARLVIPAARTALFKGRYLPGIRQALIGS